MRSIRGADAIPFLGLGCSEAPTCWPGRVATAFNIFCGSCYFCQKELYGNCHNTNPEASAVGGIYGYSHTAGGYNGGQAEYVRVPLADVGPTVIPDGLHDEDILAVVVPAETVEAGRRDVDLDRDLARHLRTDQFRQIAQTVVAAFAAPENSTSTCVS